MPEKHDHMPLYSDSIFFRASRYSRLTIHFIEVDVLHSCFERLVSVQPSEIAPAQIRGL